MNDLEREFLIKSFELEEHSRPRGSVERVVPLLSWRTIGVLCGLTGEQTDELVHQLDAAGQLRIRDAEKRQMFLLAGREFAQREMERRRRRFWRRVNWIAIPLIVLIYCLIRAF
jgi:hypothetical protein